MDKVEPAILNKRLVDYITALLRKEVRKWALGEDEDPKTLHKKFSDVLEKNLSGDGSARVKFPTREQLVALRLMGYDIKNTLHFDIELRPPLLVEHLIFNFVVGHKT